MTKYQQIQHAKQERPWKIHPVWRGIGCFMLILIPIMSFAAAVEFVDHPPSWFTIMTPEFQRPITVAPINWDWVGFYWQPSFLGLSIGDIIFTLLFMSVGFGLFTLFYAFLYRIVAPPRYSGYNSAPVRRIRH